MTVHQLPASSRRLLGTLAAWPGTGQQRARRNALAASTALAQRRLERLEVEEFLAEHAAARAAAPLTDPTATRTG